MACGSGGGGGGRALFLWSLGINRGLERVQAGAPRLVAGSWPFPLGFWRKGATPKPQPQPSFQSNPWVPLRERPGPLWLPQRL